LTFPIPLRIDTDALPRHAVADIAPVVRKTLALREVPFDVIVADTGNRGTWPRPPLVEVLFSYEHRPLRRAVHGGIRVEVREVPSVTAQVDLTVFATESAEGLKVTANYSRVHLTHEWVEALLTKWMGLMRDAA
jgi:hypothetical protein